MIPAFNVDQPVWLLFKDAPLCTSVQAIHISRSRVAYDLVAVSSQVPQNVLFGTLEELLTSLREIGEKQKGKLTLLEKVAKEGVPTAGDIHG
jgi:hypothetical protein